MELNPHADFMFGDWLTRQGLDAKGQYAYMKSGWLNRISKGVYVLSGTTPKLLHAISAYNNQLSKQCIVGAYTALELRGYSHYLSLGKPQAYLFTGRTNKLPSWMLSRVWDMTVKYMTTSFLGDDLLGEESMTVEDDRLWVSSPERAFWNAFTCQSLPPRS